MDDTGYPRQICKQVLVIIGCLLPFVQFAQTAAEIVQKADAKMRGKTAIVEISIKTIRPGWSRSMDAKAWTKGTDYSLILVQAPAKDKGIVFLKRKKEVWNWMPSLERTIKLPPSMMSQSWMGTDFTNDDLVKESSVVNDYDHTLLGDTVISGRNCYIIRMIPKATAAVVWGKLIVCIDKTDFLELHTRFYDEEGVLINIMNGYDIKLMDGRLIPTRFEMIPVEKRNHKTEMIYRSVQFDRSIEDGFFTTEKMKTIR
ncbi:outer membrane lipoprotein-sorting protein [Lacibacter cauensis]|uniref:Outer membrane lipoprotein-sorting protein n=1 Tax=Lacibacter cauensis TaxID=510947 RepID=A0A562SD87_9BACT|nr:outer membrane lipoprotein-sorting protein [Lacibacter cauensis]TWI79281.1 outer membrane lipoprotein-sorting protein [Lacibacter cauensis]